MKEGQIASDKNFDWMNKLEQIYILQSVMKRIRKVWTAWKVYRTEKDLLSLTYVLNVVFMQLPSLSIFSTNIRKVSDDQ